MTTGLWILGNQLTFDSDLFQLQDPDQDPDQAPDQARNQPIILIESLDYARSRPYHRQKLVLVWSAMRHFAADLRDRGYTDVTYITADDFATPLLNWIADRQITTLRLLDPTDFPFRRTIEAIALPDHVAIEWVANDLFFWSESEFIAWATGRKRLLMEDFYRHSRQRFEVLMTPASDQSGNAEPIGDRWNFDKDNRKPPKGRLNPPPPLTFAPDAITRDVMAQVAALGDALYGQLEPFGWGVTRSHALQVLDDFLTQRLPRFGPYQDAMLTDEPTLWHALLSPYLNLGLISPREVVAAIETAYRESNGSDRELPLASVEGVIRQILGWREYMRGLYLVFGEDYAQSNVFEHDLPLPDFFWDARKTDLNCLRCTLSQLEATGYAHHIQRLMILGNFALIAGINPQAIEQWFHAAFIDGYDWVMQTNVLGMGVFADGGKLASKPYAASANYINKMSDYCRGCTYDRGDRLGDNACPFNYLYWDFLDRHYDRLKSQGRMNLILAQLRKIPDIDRQRIREKARRFQAKLSQPSKPSC
jgi:deoxyribodipyrimidine photolyase-related protein